MHATAHTLVVRRESLGETLEIHLMCREKGGVLIAQVSWGSLTQLAFGHRAICQLLTLDGCGASLLAERLCWRCGFRAGVGEFFSQGDAGLSDLLDVCNAAGIPCRFCVVGSDGGALTSGVGAQSGVDAGAGAFSFVP